MGKHKYVIGLGLLGLLAAGGLLVAACGSDNGGTSNEAAATQAVAQPAVEQAQATAAATIEATTSAATDPTTVIEASSNDGIEKLNLNTASGEDFSALIPEFPSNMVREFLEYRPYVSIQQFRREIGKYVSDEQVAEWEQYVYVPVSVDDSDAETLKQLPGVTDEIAEALMAARPYGSNEVFLAALTEYVSPEDAVVAAAMLEQ